MNDNKYCRVGQLTRANPCFCWNKLQPWTNWGNLEETNDLLNKVSRFLSSIVLSNNLFCIEQKRAQANVKQSTRDACCTCFYFPININTTTNTNTSTNIQSQKRRKERAQMSNKALMSVLPLCSVSFSIKHKYNNKYK